MALTYIACKDQVSKFHKLRLWVIVIITATIPLSIVFIQSCSDNDGGANSHENGEFEGFEAEIYENGILVATCTTGQATLDDPVGAGYIEIASSSNEYNFRLNFNSKGYNGIDGMSPGTLDTANYTEPVIWLDSASTEYGSIVVAYIGRYSYPLDSLWFYPDTVLGTGSGEITNINSTKVAGEFKAVALDSSWEIRGCRFNLDIQ